jgi:hypothetical protein
MAFTNACDSSCLSGSSQVGRGNPGRRRRTFFQAFVAPPQNLRAILLQTARYDFPVFYLRATAREAKLMDMLVLLTALFVRLNDHREERHQKPRRRDEETAATRQMFFDLRDFIRSGATFASLPNLEQQKIQRVIFDRVM